MHRYTYDFEVQTMMTVFINALSDIVVKRFNADKTPENQIKVRVVYAPKQRVLNDLINKDQNLILPVVACYIGGLSRDSNRTFNKLVGMYNQMSDGRVLNERQPLPIDLKINVSIMTRYQADMDQILSHLLPFINPYFVLSWRTPSRPEFEIRSNVYWDGNANIQYPIELNATQVARVVGDLSFVFKGWLFQTLPKDVIGSIYTVDSTYAIANNFDVLNSYERYKTEMTSSSANYDHLHLQGTPPQPKVIEPTWGAVGKNVQFNVYGRGLTQLRNVYLSGTPFDYISTLQNPFSAISSLSSSNPPFNAAKLDPTFWTTNYDNLVTFVTPSASQPGRVDVIFENTGGWDSLTNNIRINTLNPYVTLPLLSSTTFVPYQLPYLSGVEFF
jgi:hypothetical protein